MLSFITETCPCWERLKEEKRPIFIYGMGNGALKIMTVFKQYGIPLAGIFASDDFVRGHDFEGYRVHKLSEVEKMVDDFVVVLAFAAGYPSLIEKIQSIASKHTMYVPDVPVIGEGLFTYDYCIEHADEIEKVYSLLYDNYSRKVFSNIINFKISGDISYLNDITTSKSEIYKNIIMPTKAETFIDLGAYNGDTIKEFLKYTDDTYSFIYAVEPDKKSFKKLVKAVGEFQNLQAINAAAWSIETQIPFASKAGRQSSVTASGDIINTVSVDTLIKNRPASLIIKMDVEGTEREAIWGACHTIAHAAPKLMISLYHRNEDIFKLPLLIHSLRPDYKLYMRHLPYIPAWETNLYATI